MLGWFNVPTLLALLWSIWMDTEAKPRALWTIESHYAKPNVRVQARCISGVLGDDILDTRFGSNRMWVPRIAGADHMAINSPNDDIKRLY